MRKPTASCAPSRLIASLLLFCYSLVSIVLPFQHSHGLLEELEGVPGASKVFIGTAGEPAAALHTRLIAGRAAHPLKHCLACEWQSAQVSAALPTLRLKFVAPSMPRVPATLPRYLSVRVISTSSRAPPAV